MLSGDGSELVQAFLRLFEGLYQYVDAADAIVDRIDAKAATCPRRARCDARVRHGAAAQADRSLRRRLSRGAAAADDLSAPLLGIVDRRVIEASGALGEPQYVRNELRLERIKTCSRTRSTFRQRVRMGHSGFRPHARDARGAGVLRHRVSARTDSTDPTRTSWGPSCGPATARPTRRA